MDEHSLQQQARERAAVAEVVTAMLRHDLRNRFSSIRNAAYYLKRQTEKTELWKTDPRMEVFFQLIDGELASAEALLAAREPQGPEEAPAPVLLRDAVERAFSRLGVPPRVSVERAAEERVPVEADGEELTLLIRCLLENAVEAMPEGGRLTVRTSQAEEGVLLEVADTGPGLPPERRERPFAPFVTTKPGHAGLGLSIVQRLALRSRAWVEFLPVEPSGTRVRVCFPMAREASPAGA